MSDDHRHQRVKELFLEVCDLPADRVDQVLRVQCPDPSMREEVRSLLSHHASDDAFLKTPVARVEDLLQEQEDTPPMPSHIGGYQITGLIGSGGMSIVYEARQTNPDRVVAIKVLKHTFVRRSTLRRFEFEAQILGRLRHPHIAQVYESGTFERQNQRLPYFVMEYIHEARTIIQYARDNNLPRRQRIELFTQVCDAVAHGHLKGIIHRDLKPANILVDSDGQVKVIDFGVARVLGEDASARGGINTQAGQIIGTPQYMSPEQFVGDPEDIDTRSDVFALGVVLYQLLADRLPYQVSDSSIVDAARTVQETQPPWLGTVDRHLRGDIETVVAKAMAKQRADRYASANDLARDLRNVMYDRAIEAQSPSQLQQIQRFVRRHRVGVFAAGVVCLSLALGAVVAIWYATQAEVARAQAEAAMRHTQAVNKFFSQMLGAVNRFDPNPAEFGRGAADVTVAQLLQDALPLDSTHFADAPMIEAEIRETLAIAKRSMGHFDQSNRQLKQAMSLRATHLGPDHPRTLETELLIALNYSFQLNDREAERRYRALLPRMKQVLGEHHELTLQCLLNFADALQWQGRIAEAEPIMLQGMAAQEQLLGEAHPDVISTRADYAALLMNKGQYQAALDLTLELQPLSERIRGNHDVHTLWLRSLETKLLLELGRYDEATELLAHVHRLYRDTYGENHLWTQGIETDVAHAMIGMGQIEEAERRLRDLLARQQTELAAGNGFVRETMRRLCIALIWQGRFEEALDLSSRLYANCLQALGKNHPWTFHARTMIAVNMYQLGDAVEAERVLDEVTENITAYMGEAHPWAAFTRMQLGICQRLLGKDAQAERNLLLALEVLRATRGEGHPMTIQVRQNLVALYEARGATPQAREHQRIIDQNPKPGLIAQPSPMNQPPDPATTP